MKGKINLIISSLGSLFWTGGYTYQANLIEALKLKRNIKISLANDAKTVKSNSKINSIVKRIAHRLRIPLVRLQQQVRWHGLHDSNEHIINDHVEEGIVNAL